MLYWHCEKSFSAIVDDLHHGLNMKVPRITAVKELEIPIGLIGKFGQHQ